MHSRPPFNSSVHHAVTHYVLGSGARLGAGLGRSREFGAAMEHTCTVTLISIYICKFHHIPDIE